METKEAMERYLYGTLDGLYDGALMKNMGEAVAVLIKKLREEKRIRIIGITISTASAPLYLLLTGLRRAERELGKEPGRPEAPVSIMRSRTGSGTDMGSTRPSSARRLPTGWILW